MIGTVVEHVNSGISDPWNPQETGGFDWAGEYDIDSKSTIDAIFSLDFRWLRGSFSLS